jgi:hypothetical protein
MEQRGVEDHGVGMASGGFLTRDHREHGEERLPAWRKRRARAQRVAGQVEAVLHQCGGRELCGRLKEGEILRQHALWLYIDGASLSVAKPNRQ